jgi:hypothetical protein
MDKLVIQESSQLKYLFTEGIFLEKQEKLPSKPVEKEEFKPIQEQVQYRKISFFVNAEQMNTSQEELLRNIIKAVKLSSEEVQIVPLIHASTLLPDYVQAASVEKAIFFGYKGFKDSYLNTIHQHKELSYIFTHSVEDMMKNPALKVPFWNTLKGLFGI